MLASKYWRAITLLREDIRSRGWRDAIDAILLRTSANSIVIYNFREGLGDNFFLLISSEMLLHTNKYQ